MKAHELAKKLLEGPDLPVWAKNPTQQDYPLYLDGIEGTGEHGSCEDNDEVAEGEDPITTDVILLDFCEDDGFILD